MQGTALDQLGRHDEARRYYASALKIVPGEPSVLSNLGMSYMLSKDLPKAEEALRQAYANPKANSQVRQNLGLVVGLQGRFAEAEQIVKADLPPDEAAANVAYLREMLKPQGQSRAVRRRTDPGRRAQSAPTDQTRMSIAHRLKRDRAVCASVAACADPLALRIMRVSCTASETLMPVGPRMTTNSTGRKNRIIGTVSFGGSAAAFFSASFMRMSRFSCAITRRLWPSGVP